MMKRITVPAQGTIHELFKAIGDELARMPPDEREPFASAIRKAMMADATRSRVN
jgi:hypothetical protein